MNIKALVIAILALVGLALPAIAADDKAPDEALWTIYCRSFSGPTRGEEAKLAREQLTRTTGMKDWQVVHQESETTLYYGLYRSTDLRADHSKDRKDAERAHDDLKRLRSFEDGDKNKVFPMLVFVEAPQRPGSEGPPEWNLKNVPKDMCWTVYIGIYSGTPERRRAAVQAVKALRDAGKPAYYYHDKNASLICVGTWPDGAVRMPEEAIAPPDERDAEVWASGAPLPANAPHEAKTTSGKKVILFSATAQILDPSLQSACDLNPDFMTNGVVLGREIPDPVTHKTKVIPNHSQLFRIPDRAGSAPTNTRQAPDEVRQLQPVVRPPKGAGSLNKLPD